jgi:AAA domain
VLTVLTAKAFCEQPEPPRKSELLGPLVVRGQRLVIGGHTGQGKTTFSLCLAAAIALGGEFLGWTGDGGRVLIIDAEQGRRTIQRRLREMGLEQCEHIDFVSVPDGLSLDSDERHIAEVDRVLRGGKYSVVLADPLYKLHRGDSNDERESTDLMRRFDAWREQYEFALILPVHCRKPLPSSKFSIHDIFGSTAYLRGAEVVVGLQFVRSGYSRLHFFKDRDGDLPQGERWGLLFDRERGFRRDPEDGKPRETAPDKVRRLLAAQPGMTERQMIEASGYKERTVRDALKALGAHGVRSGANGEKTWTLPEDEDEA